MFIKLVRKILHLSGKSQEISETSGCGNHDISVRRIFFKILILDRSPNWIFPNGLVHDFGQKFEKLSYVCFCAKRPIVNFC